MIKLLHLILTLFVITILSIIVSFDRKKIRIYFIIQMLLIEIFLARFLLNSHKFLNISLYLSAAFNKLFSFAAEGTNFVFGNMNQQGLAFFFLNVLCPIIFISALIGILQYIRILPFIVRIIGTILSKINGMGRLESFNAISSLILGQSENFIVYKNFLDKISNCRMYTLATTAMSTVSLSILGAYMTLLLPKYIFTAIILNVFSTFIVLSILNPYKINESDDFISYSTYKNNGFFEMLMEYILTGFKIAIIIAATLIGFIALISSINSLSHVVFGISFQKILGYIFFPIAWAIGVPFKEAIQVSSIMATKIISNEFVAMLEFKKIMDQLSQQSICIISIFLVSFSNFSSIGIISGALKGLNERQSNFISNNGLKLVYTSTLISILSSSIAAFVL